jgi:hypothetical protein
MLKVFKILIVFIILFATKSYALPITKHFIYFGRDNEEIHKPEFYSNPNISGAQITYIWKRIEPEKDTYDFEEIENDFAFLKSKGKKLFIQISDVSFVPDKINVPDYLLNDPVYNGGIAFQYEFKNDVPVKKAGSVSRRWDKNVSKRFHKLLKELGKKFNGKVEGINLPETSIEVSNPEGFTNEVYRDAIKENMLVLKKAFPDSVTIQYANFMPGEFLPDEDHSYLRDLYKYAKEINVGMGGPDLLVYQKWQMNNSYSFIKDSAGFIITGIAVQDGNYDHINPKTNKKVTIKEIFDFGQNYLKLNYIFWCIEEPYYSKEVLPFLKKLK